METRGKKSESLTHFLFNFLSRSLVKEKQKCRLSYLVADLERADGADLELPLAGHDLGVDAGDDQAGLDAGVLLRIFFFEDSRREKKASEGEKKNSFHLFSFFPVLEPQITSKLWIFQKKVLLLLTMCASARGLP